MAASSRDDAHVRAVPVVLMLLVLATAFLLRVDAAVGRFGAVPGLIVSEAGQRRLAELGSRLAPDAVTWEQQEDPYLRGDPASYLHKARAMRSFYAPDTREPMYVASVKLGLWAFNGDSVAITYVSMAYSLLLVWATYLLGAYALCRWVGLAAATLVAGEFEIIRWSVEGWRDDAFAFAFVISMYAFLRLATAPAWRAGVRAGLAAGFATLLRITSLSFVLPGLVVALFPWICGTLRRPGAVTPAFRRRWRSVAVAGLLLALLLGPFLLNCWIEFGDPLYSINFATRFYRERAGNDASESMDVGAYLATRAGEAPLEFVDLVINGVTTYPFTNKWRGLAPWSPALPWWLSRLSIVGLALFLWSPRGRYLLLLGLASLAPYAFTWRIAGGAEWRFTMHMYPLYLLAAMWAVDRGARFALRLSRPDFSYGPAEQNQLLRRGFVTVLGGLALVVVLQELPYRILLDDLRAGRVVNFRVGEGDQRHFASGWYPPVAGPNVTARYNRSENAVIRLPMIAGEDHQLTLRLQPYHEEGAPASRVEVWFNGEPLTDLTLSWNPARVGSYDLMIPGSAVHEGLNQIELRSPLRFRADVGSGNPFVVEGQRVGFFVWYVNVTAIERGHANEH